MSGSATEPLTEYFRRVVVADPFLVECRAKAQALAFEHRELPIRIWPCFSPSRFTPCEVTAGHDGADRVPYRWFSDRFVNLMDREWFADQPPLSESLDVRMAALDIPQLSPKKQTDDPPAIETEMIALCRAAARRRDILVADLCDALRNGSIRALGFQASDITRRVETLPPEWWGDTAMACHWKQGELRPVAGAPNGTPHFRGLTISREQPVPSMAPGTTEKPKAPFDPEQAHGIIYSMKRRGRFPGRPTPGEVQDILAPHFDHVPRDPVKRMITKLWGAGKRGPRNPRNPQLKAKA